MQCRGASAVLGDERRAVLKQQLEQRAFATFSREKKRRHLRRRQIRWRMNHMRVGDSKAQLPVRGA